MKAAGVKRRSAESLANDVRSTLSGRYADVMRADKSLRELVRRSKTTTNEGTTKS